MLLLFLNLERRLESAKTPCETYETSCSDLQLYNPVLSPRIHKELELLALQERCFGQSNKGFFCAVSNCLSAGTHPLTPGLLLPCWSGFPPFIFFLCSYSGFFCILSFSPSLTSPYVLNVVWTIRDFSWSLGTVVEMVSCSAFLLFLCLSLNPADQQHFCNFL